MLNKIFLNILSIIISFIDYPNKKKITFFLKKKFQNQYLKIIDIGSHKGETLNLFLN